MTRYTVGKLAYGGAANKYVAAEQQTQSVRVVTLSAVVLTIVLSVVLPYHLNGLQPQKISLYIHMSIYMRQDINERDTEILILQ